MVNAIAGNFFATVLTIILHLLDLYVFIVIGRVVMSWISVDPYNPIVQFFVKATEPFLSRIRRILPPMGGLDLSPMILIIGVILIKSLIVPLLSY